MRFPRAFTAHRCFLFYWMVLGSMTVVRGVRLLFPREDAQVTLPFPYPALAPLYQVTAVPMEGAAGSLTYKIDRITTSLSKSRKKRLVDLFNISSSTGILWPTRDIDTERTELLRESPVIYVSASDDASSLSKKAIIVRLRKSDSGAFCRPTYELCFLSQNVQYRIPESMTPGLTIDRLRPPPTGTLCPNASVEYHLLTGEGVVVVDPSTGELSLSTSLDYEKNESVTFQISCSVAFRDGNTTDYSMQGTINVLDVDDNAPYLQTGEDGVFDINSSDIVPKRLVEEVQLNVLDKDTKEANHIEVYIEDDPLHFFAVKKTRVYEKAVDGAMLMNADLLAKKPLLFSGPIYNVSVVFEDTSYHGQEDNKVVFHVRVHNQSAKAERQPFYTHNYTILSKTAALHTRVLQPLPVDEQSGFRFHLHPHISSRDIFDVTRRTGIIYVANVASLQSTNETVLPLNVTWTSGDTEGVIEVLVHIREEEISSKKCDSLCSTFETERSCNTSCGRGSVNGSCQWRKAENKDLSSKYSTCSPDLATCPNGHCDELEKDLGLCLQDCSKTINGQATRLPSGRGIHLAISPCHCSVTSCQCGLEHASPSRQVDSSERTGGKFSVSVPSTTGPNTPSADHENESKPRTVAGSEVYFKGLAYTTACGPGCVAFIFLAVSCSLALCIIFMFYRRLKTRKKRQEKHKYVGSGMSLSAIPSDYVDDRSSSVHDSQAFSDTSSSSKGVCDAKWEFPREHLILEQTLGEGEFGRVLKAQAWGINGIQMYSTVAVKMLKGNGTIIEQQDLLSEFQMLKEVCHPNVVRLLGACTQKGGPFYIIVEYAEHGSLRSYLRRSRHLEISCGVPPVRSFDNPTYVPQNGECEQQEVHSLSQRDLLSFAWQISKGMAYLSDLKLVHRDLAARNVLVAAGNVLKISDFGLSRDVYEGDTYLKKSKGRVPVKWMAIESLEDHIYTTRSDVWSFGIVLWEIVTLGATPYPGVTPERLFHLLKAGYRMAKPAHCLEELYQIMKACWRENAHDRPAFKELVQRFDNLLQDTTDYMDLNAPAPDREVLLQPPSCLSYYREEDKDENDIVLEYGSILHSQDGSLDSNPEDSLGCVDPLLLVTITEPDFRHTEGEKTAIREIQDTIAEGVM